MATTDHTFNAIKHGPKVLAALAGSEAHVATLYVSDKEVVRATRRRYKARSKRRAHYDNNSFEIVFTACRPNFVEREFIKLCKKAKQALPLRRPILRFPSKNNSTTSSKK